VDELVEGVLPVGARLAEVNLAGLEGRKEGEGGFSGHVPSGALAEGPALGHLARVCSDKTPRQPPLPHLERQGVAVDVHALAV
jgi:hypothetical protein